MHSNYLLLALPTLLICLTTSACDVDEPDSYTDTDERGYYYYPKPITIPAGETWGPCDFSRSNDPNWWGCNGSPGYGLACLRPVSNDGLNICAPQTWDPLIDDDCDGLIAPFGLGVRLQGSAYCVPDCMTDADCGPGRKCSPQSHFCAWVGE